MIKATAYELSGSDVIVARNSAGAVKVSDDIGDILAFLRYSSRQTLRVFLDLDEAVAVILRKLPADVLQQLHDAKSASYGDHHLYYMPRYIFEVGMSKFYGIKSFFGLSDYVPYTPLEKVQQMADDLLEALDNIGLGNPRKLTSAGAIFEDSDWGKQVYSNLPTAYGIPSSCGEILDYAMDAGRRMWVANHQIGHWGEGEIWDYDISSCHPYLASRLPDLRECSIWKSNAMGKRERSALHGLVKGKFYLDPGAEYAHCSPIMADVGGLLGNPLGNLPTSVYSLDEVRFVENNGIGEFKMKDGWFLHPDYVSHGHNSYPFRDIMESLFQLRQRSPLVSSIAKIMAVQLVGKLIETKKPTGEYGPIFNGIYYTLISAGTRVEVAKFLVANEIKPQELIAIQVDGCRLTRKISLGANGLGRWRCNGSAPTIVLSPTKIYSADKRPYRLTYDDLVNMVTEHPLSERYKKTVKHRITFDQASEEEKDLTMVGMVVDRPARLDLITQHLEQVRHFPDLPHNGRAIFSNRYQSLPIVLT